jgi:hypothetical protein
VDTACELFKAKADITSSLLNMPYVYGSSNENSTATLALGYSIGGYNRSGLVKEIAAAKCASLATTSTLEDQQKWILLNVYKIGARDEYKGLVAAKAKAVEHLALLEEQLKTQNITLNEYNASKQVLLNIEEKINAVRLVLAEPSEPVDFANIKMLLAKAKESDGRIAELTAREEAATAWDISVGVGTQKELSNIDSSVKPFVGVNFRWSFGAIGMDSKVAKVKEKTEQLFVESRAGYVQNASRLLTKIVEVNKLETDREVILTQAMNDTKRLITAFKDLDTELANSTKRALTIQAMIIISELDGIRARLQKYQEIIAAQ